MTASRALRIGLDTLFLTGGDRSSLANFIIALTQAIAALNTEHKLVLYSSRHTAPYFASLPDGSAEIVMCPVSNENRLARILYQQLRLPGVIARSQVDVLCCLADVAPLRVSVPVVLKVNSLQHLRVPGSIGALRALYRRIMILRSARLAEFVVANSVPTAGDIEVLLGIDRNRIRLIYEAVDDSFQPPADAGQARAVASKRFGIAAPYILFVSALYRYKNVDHLIRAFQLLINQRKWSGELVVVGSDPHHQRPVLEHLASELGIRRSVRFLGHVDNRVLPELYQGASLFVYPSASETFGKPVVEAMRCGTPTVAADRGSIPDIARGAAVLVDPEDIQAIATGMHRLLNDGTLRRRLRDIGLKRGSDFSWKNVASGFLEVIEAAAN